MEPIGGTEWGPDCSIMRSCGGWRKETNKKTNKWDGLRHLSQCITPRRRSTLTAEWVQVRPHARWNQTRFRIPAVRSVGLRSVTQWLLIKRNVAPFGSGGVFCFFSSNLHMMRLISSVPSKETTPGQMLYYLLNTPLPVSPSPLLWGWTDGC